MKPKKFAPTEPSSAPRFPTLPRGVPKAIETVGRAMKEKGFWSAENANLYITVVEFVSAYAAATKSDHRGLGALLEMGNNAAVAVKRLQRVINNPAAQPFIPAPEVA